MNSRPMLAEQVARHLFERCARDIRADRLQFAANPRDDGRIGLEMQVTRPERVRLLDPFLELHSSPAV